MYFTNQQAKVFLVSQPGFEFSSKHNPNQKTLVAAIAHYQFDP